MQLTRRLDVSGHRGKHGTTARVLSKAFLLHKQVRRFASSLIYTQCAGNAVALMCVGSQQVDESSIQNVRQ